jgi:hypothetical protein
MNKQLIGFCGFARSGKDTAMLALYGRDYYRLAFADALKCDVQSSLDRSLMLGGRSEVGSPLFSGEFKEKFRPLLVEYGRAMRVLLPDYWVVRLEHDNAKALELHNIAVTDVRYRNEADWIHSRGGRVVLIQKPDVTAANAEESASIGEMIAAGCFDLVIQNDSSIDDLHAKVLQYVNSLDTDTKKENS